MLFFMKLLRAIFASFLIFLSLLSCEKPDDGPRHLTQEEIDEINAKKKEQQKAVDLTRYVEYREGDCPIIFCVPHGGTLTDSSLKQRTSANCPDPDFACDLDYNTRELASAIDDAFFARTGKHPYMIVAIVKRTHVDFNREKKYAIASGDEIASSIYDYYHSCATKACRAVSASFGHGLLLDIHGQSHSEQIDLGYLLSVSDLNKTDAALNAGTYASSSSISHLSRTNKAEMSFASLLRGPNSLGGLLYSNGLECVPRPGNASPGATPYFNGGYTTKKYGSFYGGVIDAVQMEFRYSYRDTPAGRNKAAVAVAAALDEFTSVVW